MNVDDLIDILIAHEGGYCDNPADHGGKTRWGITERIARQHGYGGEMRALPRAEAVDIYRRRYWAGPGLDAIAVRAPDVSAELFDTGVNMGPATAISFLQRALNALNRGGHDYPDIIVDGHGGPATLGALDAFLARRTPGGEAVLVKAIEALRGALYVTLAEAHPADEAFLYGWLANRIG
ncbi:MAG: glycosyl hydrolase 108 family protein [Sphingomonas sp.]